MITIDPRAFHLDVKEEIKADKPDTQAQQSSLNIRKGKYKLPPSLSDADRPPLSTYKSPENSSSSIDKPRVLPVHPSKLKTLPSEIAELFAESRMKEDRPIDLFRHLRERVIKGQPTPPIFEPNHFQLPLVLRALFRYASDNYLRILADEERYLSVFRAWLRQCIADPSKWAGSIVLLLRVLSRMDMPIDFMRTLEIGKLAKRLRKRVDDLNLPIRDETNAAFQQFEKYCRDVLLPRNRQSSNDKEKTDEKKRKAEAEAGPTKKQKTVPASSTSTDMSFFTAPESSTTKRPLPSIKKHAVPPTAAKPVNLLQQTLQSLTRPADPMSRPATDLIAPPVAVPAVVPRPVKKMNKKGHTVQFVDEVKQEAGLLENIRLFSQEDFEFDAVPWQNDTHGASTHQLEAAEGSAMKVHEHLEEEVDWVEPSGECYLNKGGVKLMPEYTGIVPIIEATPETLVQEARERGILGSTYETAATPDESDVRTVQKGPSTRGWYQPATAPPVAAQTSSVSALLGALNPSMFGHVPAAVPSIQAAYNNYGGYSQQSYEYTQPAPVQNSWGAQPYGGASNGYPAQNNAWGQNGGYGQQQPHQQHHNGYQQHDGGYRGRGRGWGKR